MNFYESRAILSPSMTTILVHAPIQRMPSPLVAPVCGGGGGEWSFLPSHPNPIHHDLNGIADCIFHKGRLYVLWRENALAVYHLLQEEEDVVIESVDFLPFADDDQRPPQRYGGRGGGASSDNSDSRYYLVESPDGDELFLVRKSKRYKDYLGFVVKKLCFDGESGKYCWTQVESLGDVAFFVGHGFSLALSVPPPGPTAAAAAATSLRPNSIYFTDSADKEINLRRWYDVGCTGVYHLGDGSYNFYKLTGHRYVCGDGGGVVVKDFDWQLPVWYMPDTSSSSSCSSNFIP